MKEVIDIFGPNRTVLNRGVGGTEGHKEKKGPIVSYHKFVFRIRNLNIACYFLVR